MDSVAATKSKKKNFFPCFRSTASDAPVRTARGMDAADKQVFPFMVVEERNSTMLHNVQPFDGGDDVTGHRKKKGGGGALSCALKAVLFGTSLAKKIRKRKEKQKQNSNKENQRRQLLSSISSRSRISSNPNFRNSSTCSTRSSAPFSSSSNCSSSPTSTEISEITFGFHPTASNPLFRQINLRKISSNWFVLLVCLLTLVLWGKIGAITCTSIWILCFYLYRRGIGFRSSDDKPSTAALNSGEYRKKIVIDGFLNRDRSASHNSIIGYD